MDGYFGVDVTDSTVIPSVVIGRKCDSCLPNCKICSNPLNCDTCFPGYLINGAKTTCNCDATLANLLNCHSCTVNITCSNCDSGYFVSSATGKCEPCSYIHSSCNLCSD